MTGKLRGRALLFCLATVVAPLLVACEDDPAGGPGPVAALQAVTPAQITAYAATQNRVYVRAVDADGDPVPGATVQWRVVSGGGSIGAAGSVTNLEGIAEVAWTLGTTVGAAAQLEASHANAQAVVFTATAALPPGVAITLLGAGQLALPLAPLPQPVGVRVTLPDGRPLAGVPVFLTAPPNSPAAVVPVAEQPTDALGEARFTWTVPAQAGTYTLHGSVGAGVQRTGVQIPVTVVPGPPTQVFPVSYNTPCAPAGTVVDPPWGLRLLDAYNNPTPGIRVDFTARPGSSVTPATALTDAGGTAVTQWRVRTTPGVDSMVATVPSLGHTHLFAKDVCAGPAVRLELYRAGVPLNTPPLLVGRRRVAEVRLFDAGGTR